MAPPPPTASHGTNQGPSCLLLHRRHARVRPGIADCYSDATLQHDFVAPLMIHKVTTNLQKGTKLALRQGQMLSTVA